MSFLFVKCYHGPCNTFNTARHKPQKLTGIKDRLQKIGYTVKLIPDERLNYCMLEICGHEVFRCNIMNLKFNTCYEEDPVAQRAVEAVITSSVKFRRARAYLWFWALLENELWRSKYSPKEHYLTEIVEEHFVDRFECLNCCNIVVRQLKDEEQRESEQIVVKVAEEHEDITAVQAPEAVNEERFDCSNCCDIVEEQIKDKDEVCGTDCCNSNVK